MLVYTRQKNIAQVFILERYFFCFHLSGSNSRYLLSDVLDGSAAALLMTSDIYSKKLIPCSQHEHASEYNMAARLAPACDPKKSEFRPAVFSDLMLVVLVVKEVDKAYDKLGIEIVPTWYIFLMKRMGMSS